MNKIIGLTTVLLILLAAVPVVSALSSSSSSSSSSSVSASTFHHDHHHHRSHHHNVLLFSTLVGSTPGVTVAGVAAGGAPWVVSFGAVRLTSTGRLDVVVRGLVIFLPGNPLNGTTGPVTGVQASLACGGTVVSSTGVAPL